MNPDSKQYKDQMIRKVIKEVQKGGKNMKKANEICPNCPANKNETVVEGNKTRPFCILYKWNLKKIMDVDGIVPCSVQPTKEEAKKYDSSNRTISKKSKKSGK